MSKSMRIDSATTRVIRVSYAGELGYELHIERYQILSIFESLLRVGEKLGLRHFGGYAFNSLRMEKAYRAWGTEFTEEISGLEADMSRFINLKKNFIGRENLKGRLSKGLITKLAYVAFDDDVAAECFGNEAVYSNGELVGLTTSGGFGHRVGFSLAFAYIPPELIAQNTKLEIQTAAGLRSAHVELKPVYDPENAKLKS